jgi:hypothetical protein
MPCLSFELPPEWHERLAAGKIESGFRHDFLRQDFVRDIVYAGTWNQIECAL